MAQLDKTFPTLDCSICILAPKMIECFRHPNITLLSYSEVKEVNGSAGNFEVKVLRKPRYVDESKCTGCGICTQKCPVKVPSEFDMGLGVRKAIYIPFPQAIPLTSTIDSDHCLYFQKGVCRICEKFCPAGAINFEQKPVEVKLKVSAIIVSTGFDLLNPSILKEYGYGRYKNVLTSLEFERMVSASGPTGGKLIRPSDKKEATRVAFIQCVGSRDLKCGYPYCSSICCMYATKEAILVKEHVYIFYTDLRAFGKGFREFVNRAKNEWGINYIRAKPSDIREDPATKELSIWYEDTLSGEINEVKVDLVVLCPAMVPRKDSQGLARVLGVEVDEYGFFKSKHPLRSPIDSTKPGVFLCGCCQGPKDISDSVAQASGAAGRVAEFLASLSS